MSEFITAGYSTEAEAVAALTLEAETHGVTFVGSNGGCADAEECIQ